MHKKIVKILLEDVPDRELDPKVKETIRKWNNPPTALQILEVLDMCVHGSLTNALVIKVLETLLEKTIEKEKTSYEEVVSKATWRNK